MKFTRVIVVESLEDFEVKTGFITAELIAGKLQELGRKTSVEYHRCDSSYEFKTMIDVLINEAASGSIPLLHIECHGDPVGGLEFENGTMITWRELSKIISPLNLATGFNLMLCMSACHAASFLGQMSTISSPCPCRVLIAPTETVTPAECLVGFRKFYSELFQKFSFVDAVELVEELENEVGGWLGESAESWFEYVTHDYVLTQCSKEMVRDRVMGVYRRLQKEGVRVSLKRVRSEFRQAGPRQIFRGLFEQFFGLNERPDLREEFADVYEDLMLWIDIQRKAGRCAI